MNQSAVILLSGKQYLVQVGDKIEAELVEAKPGDKISVKEVLMISHDDQTEVGSPYLTASSVELSYDGETMDDKIEIRKFKGKSRYRRTTGHRQKKSQLTVTSININR